MKDINGTEVNKGNMVVYMCPKHRELRHGIVLNTSKNYATILHSNEDVTDWKNPFGKPLRVKSVILSDVKAMIPELLDIIYDDYIRYCSLIIDNKYL